MDSAVPPPPPITPPPKVDLAPMARRGLGSKGHNVAILTNHFKVTVGKLDGGLYHYSVALSYDDGTSVEGKGVGRKILDQVRRTYSSELGGKEFAYDGDNSLFTVGPLPSRNLDFTTVLESFKSSRTTGNSSPSESDSKRMKWSFNSKTFKVKISFATEIPMQAIASTLRGQESDKSQEVLRVLDIVLRQHAAGQGCLLVRQSFFHDKPNSTVEVGEGVLGCRGFHSSFRTTQNGLSLNMDVSTTMIVQPGPVAKFLVANQKLIDPSSVDWAKAKRTLKNLRIEVSPDNREFKITGLSEKTCRDQTFTLKQRNEDGEVGEETQVTVYDYFVKQRKIELRYSADLPCINVGKPKRPTYFPIELCSLVSLQRYTKALSTLQRSSLVEKSRQLPRERMTVLSNALENNNYGAVPMLRSCGVSINNNFTEVEGRALTAPKLKAYGGQDLFTRNGRWNFNNKRLAQCCRIGKWAVVNFSSTCNVRNLVKALQKVGQMKGVFVENPYDAFEESRELIRDPPVDRVEKMFKILKSKLPGEPEFLLCLLPERKNCDIYGPWKKKVLSENGIVTQCLSPTDRMNDQYLTNLLLKINAKLGGLNSLLAHEISPFLPMISKYPTLIIGMDVSHGSPGQSDIPSIAAVVSSRQWPYISRYRACVRTQSPKHEMIDSLYKPVPDTTKEKDDVGIMRELLLDFYTSSGNRKPDQIIIFRDGVSESQFNQVLNTELTQITEACKRLEEKYCPKFTVIVAQKNHHTKFFQQNSQHNVPPGTIIDTKVCHPKNNDFYLCAHAGMIGTTRPTHYHVLLDEVVFSPDDLQELVHSLSYVYQRGTTAISVVAPIRYAHLAASQFGQMMKFVERPEASSSSSSQAAATVPLLPPLKTSVCNTMFFC